MGSTMGMGSTNKSVRRMMIIAPNRGFSITPKLDNS